MLSFEGKSRPVFAEHSPWPPFQNVHSLQDAFADKVAIEIMPRCSSEDGEQVLLNMELVAIYLLQQAELSLLWPVIQYLHASFFEGKTLILIKT